MVFLSAKEITVKGWNIYPIRKLTKTKLMYAYQEYEGHRKAEELLQTEGY